MKKILSLILVLMLLLTACSAAFADPMYSLGDRTISRGMTGQDVLEAQERLTYYSYYSGTLDGNYGAGTYRAVSSFQSRNGLVVTGIIDSKTAAMLLSDTAVHELTPTSETYVLSAGDSGEAVKELQRQLRQTYYYSGTIDGVYGGAVITAVKAFQASAGLTADGKAGAKTKDALYNRTANIFNGGIPIRTLGSGYRGYDVYVLQQKLIDLNYLSIVPSGFMATATVTALSNFQKDNGLKVTGTLNDVTRRALWPTTIQLQEEIENALTGTEDDPYAEPTLRYGAHGNMVANAQMRLKAAGYLLGSADGIYGKATMAAVKKLQKDYGLTVDGVLGPSTWTILKLFNTSNAEPDLVDTTKKAATVTTKKLQRGSTGSVVTKLQQALISLGYLSYGEDDGIFGAKTYVAVRNFQKAMGLSVDGIAGTNTLVKINEELGVQYITP